MPTPTVVTELYRPSIMFEDNGAGSDAVHVSIVRYILTNGYKYPTAAVSMPDPSTRSAALLTGNIDALQYWTGLDFVLEQGGHEKVGMFGVGEVWNKGKDESER